jgi:2-dehydro-3-deoxygalactonokinase
MTNTDPVGLLVDWGTSNVRAWSVVEDGTVLSSAQSSAGISQIADGNFSAAFDDVTAQLTTMPLPTLMSGMIGSRQGWIEAPYLTCPVSLGDLALQLTPVPTAPHIRIVPGVHLQTATGSNDVMRGEEVQIAGVIELASSTEDQLICLPGTHSKWAHVEKGVLSDFATSMTGEVFAAMSNHTILGALLPKDGDNPSDITSAGFDAGLKRASENGGLLHHLFGVRAEGLFDTIPACDLRGFLSGILIGHEVRDMLAQRPGSGPVIVVGEAQLAEHYVHAITQMQHAASAIDSEQATIAGLAMILNKSQ